MGVGLARFRLRFLLQEFDLPVGTTLIGRSSSCHVTIEDPLVSRQHARIDVEGDACTISDLGSRNGLRVNGKPINGKHPLDDGDRIRIGTQEFLFCRVAKTTSAAGRTTGFLQHCGHCGLPYAKEAVTCPSCGAKGIPDAETLSGEFGAQSQHAWSLQLLTEVVDAALRRGRIKDAVKSLERAQADLAERLTAGRDIDERGLAELALAALTVGKRADDARWAAWVASVYVQSRLVPPAAVLDAIAEAVVSAPGALLEPARELVDAAGIGEREDARRLRDSIAAARAFLSGETYAEPNPLKLN